LTIRELPPIDLILISHSHYDHLDLPSLRELGPSIPIACPLGLSRLLHRWGFPKAVEYGWGDRGELGDARLICLPAQHGAARTLFDRDATLWCGWMLEIGGRRIFFAGDTGYAPYFSELFAPLAPVDLALLPIGAYAPRWFMRPLHINPSEAVLLHRDLRARVSIAMHWGTFRLADEPLDAPPAQLRNVLANSSISEPEFRIARFGETIALSSGTPS
jgi:N-acyl-phosphatidylethanolamine-hydrolysing phospholipase D